MILATIKGHLMVAAVKIQRIKALVRFKLMVMKIKLDILKAKLS